MRLRALNVKDNFGGRSPLEVFRERQRIKELQLEKDIYQQIKVNSEKMAFYNRMKLIYEQEQLKLRMEEEERRQNKLKNIQTEESDSESLS